MTKLFRIWLTGFILMPASLVSQQTEVFTWSVFNNNFFYDKEFSNHIADGMTLPGNLINLEIIFHISKTWQLAGGVYGLKYWGNEEKFIFKPLLALQFQNRKHYFRMGNLPTWKGRDYLFRPVYDESFRFRAEALETGMEYAYQTTGFILKTYLDWHRFIRKRDTMREKLNFVLYAQKDWQLTAPWHIRMPLAALIHHRGGQINLKGHYQKNINSILSVLTLAGGTELRYSLNNHSDLVFFVYGLMHTMNSNNPEELKFKKGKAFWIGIRWYSNHWAWAVSRWEAHRFNSPLGEDIFQTVSRRVDKYLDHSGNAIPHFANHTEPYRELWISRLEYKQNPTQHLDLSTKIEFFYQPYRSSFNGVPYLDDVVNHWDFLLSLQLIYRL